MTVLKRQGVRWTRGVRAELKRKVDDKTYMNKAVDWLAEILTSAILDDDRILNRIPELDRRELSLDMFIDGYDIDEICEKTKYSKNGFHNRIKNYCEKRNLDYAFFKAERKKNKRRVKNDNMR